MATREKQKGQDPQRDDSSPQTQDSGYQQRQQDDDTFSGGGLIESGEFGTGGGVTLPSRSGEQNIPDAVVKQGGQYGGSGTWDAGDFGGAPGSPIMEIKIYAPSAMPPVTRPFNAGNQKDKFAGPGTVEGGEYGSAPGGNSPLIEIRLFMPSTPRPTAQPNRQPKNKARKSG